MAKQTGQITVLKNNTVTNVEHQIRFIFTKNNGERITRDTTAKGVINFDIPNGDWNVSWFAVDGDQKVLPLRAGLQLKITSSTPPTALADWIYGGNTHVADPILTQWTTVLDEMKAVRDQLRDETSFVGTGNIVRESITDRKLDEFVRYLRDEHINNANEVGLYSTASSQYISVQNGYPIDLKTTAPIAVYRWGTSVLLQVIYTDNAMYTRRYNLSGGESPSWSKFYSTGATVVDSNGFIKVASPVLRLFNDRIETNDQFDKEPIFEKIGVGTYKISNTLGLAKDGWTYEKPRGSDGNPYFRIVVEKLEDGCIITVHDEYVDYEDKEIIDSEGNKRTVKERVTVLSAARDIKDHERWIDLRFYEEPQEADDEELLTQLDNLDESAH